MATNAPTRSWLNDERVCEVLASYFEDLEAGRLIDPQQVIDKHPDLAPQLSDFFASRQLFSRLMTPLHDVAGLEQSVEKKLDSTFPPQSTTSSAELQAEGWPDGVIGDHVLLEEVQSGGMGVVYRAWQRSLRRIVALKVVAAGRFATAAERRRFQAEAEAAAALDHPNIVPIYTVGQYRGCDFYTMRLIDGKSLADRVADFASDPHAAAELVAKLAQAMHYAHQRGVLHRDLKPSNILLDGEGSPHVTDFGLAKRSGGPDLTLTGDVLGSPPYMAPEQTGSAPGGTTVATDVYGLGAIFYTLLTGRPPFAAESAFATMELVRSQPPTPPRSINSNIDPDLQTICLKCLEKEPEARYSNALELAEDLNRWLDGIPIVARPADWRRRAWLWCRHPARQRETGVYSMLMGILLTLWACLGILLVSLGVIRTPSRSGLIVHVSCFIVLAYLPMILFGHAVIRGKPWAIRGGLVHASTLLALDLINILGFYRFGAEKLMLEYDPKSLSMDFTLFFMAVFSVTATYVVANISLSSSRRLSRSPTRTGPAHQASTEANFLQGDRASQGGPATSPSFFVD